MREAQVGQRDRLIRLGLDSEAEIVFAIVRENRDDAGNVTYVQEARVRLERASEAITRDVVSHDIARAVLARFRTLRTTHTGEDASRALEAIATASLEAELAQLQTETAAFVSAPRERTSTLTRRLEALAALCDRAKLYRGVLAITVTDLDRQLDEMSATVEGMINQKAISETRSPFAFPEVLPCTSRSISFAPTDGAVSWAQGLLDGLEHVGRGTEAMAGRSCSTLDAS